MSRSTERTKHPYSAWRRVYWIIPLLVAILLLLNHRYQWYPWPWAKVPEPTEKSSLPQVSEEPKRATVIDYQKIKEPKIGDDESQDLKTMVEQRKKDFGVDKSVDMVVKPGEYIRVGKELVPLNRILAEIEAQAKTEAPSIAPLTSPARSEEDEEMPPAPSRYPVPKPAEQTAIGGETAVPNAQVASSGEARGPFVQVPQTTAPSAPAESHKLSPTLPFHSKEQPVSYYGIYVVRPGDNLWNIHFAFLKEYFAARGIDLPSDADEPISHRSSGVARILKYAENMVYIFNLKTKKLSKDLNLLQPLEKVVVFNLSNLHRILAPLTYEKIDKVHFDGRDIVLPPS